jgi:hypothetical protein
MSSPDGYLRNSASPICLLFSGTADVVSTSTGHGSPALTLKVYAQLFRPDARAAKVMDAALKQC